MKIIIATTSSLSYKLVEGQINYLSKKGHDVIFLSSFDDAAEKKVRSEGGEYIPVNFKREISLFSDFKSLYEVFKIIKKEKPDIINYSTPKAGLLFSLVSFFFSKTKFIFTLRGLRSDTLIGFKKRIVFLTEKISCSLSDKVIVISPSLLSHAVNLKLLKKNKAIVFGKGSSNGIDINKFKITSKLIEEGNELKKKLKIPKEAIIFGYIGRLVKDKGIVELFDAFNEINKKYPNTYLVLTGSVEDGDYLGDDFINTISSHSNIRHIGFTDDVPTVLSIYDVLVLYSYREGFGNVAIEASSMCRPVLVSNIPGAKDTIEDNVTGLLVEPKNAKELFSKMDYYLLNPDLLKEHGLNGRKRIEKYFSSDKIWSQQLDLYESMNEINS